MRSELNELANILERVIREEPSDPAAHVAWVERTRAVQRMIEALWEKEIALPLFLYEYFVTCNLFLETPSLRDPDCMEFTIHSLRNGHVPTDGELKDRHKARERLGG